MAASSTDSIVKQVHINAPRSRVWRAVSDASEFGAWFGISFSAPFEAGKPAAGRIVDPPGYENAPFDMVVERIEPEHYFSLRWHPYAIDPATDYSQEPKTLIEFTLEEVGDGTLLTVVESGFDSVPLQRRAEAFEMNSGGWEIQVQRVRQYVETGTVSPIA
jgi:uncharacterized protein YndB with AHSA1/START domain